MFIKQKAMYVHYCCVHSVAKSYFFSICLFLFHYNTTVQGVSFRFISRKKYSCFLKHYFFESNLESWSKSLILVSSRKVENLIWSFWFILPQCVSQFLPLYSDEIMQKRSRNYNYHAASGVCNANHFKWGGC